jgi:anti-sigma regulatory factor (Ser/Thr protein kinase)
MSPNGTCSADVDVVLAGEPASVTEARRLVTALARELGAVEYDVALAVSEAVGNAVMHAFVGREPGTVRVRAQRRRERLVVIVSDDGIGMMPNLESPGLGMGVSLITRVADDVRFDSSRNGTTVSMGFGLGDRRSEPSLQEGGGA